MVDFSVAGLLDLMPFIAVGLAAQMVDGALGMAFGIISSALLISLGVPPAAASASVHTVEGFTTAASGASHIAHRNVDWRLLARLAIPGLIGGILGAYALSRIDAAIARPVVLVYLAILGLYLIRRGLAPKPEARKPKVVEPLGIVGGFLDAAGGGGWGPIVTSNLLLQGGQPRKVIGTVNTAEFIVSTGIAATFITTTALEGMTTPTLGLLVGGIVVAPFGAWMTKRVKTHRLLVLVGGVLTITSLAGLLAA